MKKLGFLLLFVMTLVSCLPDDNTENINFENKILPVDTVDIADEFRLGETHRVTLNYTRPNGCYVFNQFIVDSIDNQRIIAIVDTFYTEAECSQEPVEASVSFDFLVTRDDNYIFQFYQGQDDQGMDQYLIIEVPVVE